ncbi:MAG TPA: hypothetical protein VFS60_03525, partial [Thermoanaerobaculia bacterium]|nr:hypothetical protein [Thermoanaerobaculia bacterium]
MPDRIRLLSCVVLAFAVCLAIACKDEEKKAEPEVVVDGTGIGADATTTETTEMMGTDMGTDMSAQPTDMSVSTEMTVPTTEPPAASRGWFGSPGRPPAAPRTRRDDGASLDGDRLTFYATTTADQCEADCWADVRCAGWALIRQGFYAPTDPPMCYLLSRVTASTPSPC